MMGDKFKEQNALNQLLEQLELAEGVGFRVKIRPEDDETEPGTYDFLCIEKPPGIRELAVEVTTLSESHDRKAFDVAVGGVAAELRRKLEGSISGTYELQIVGPSRRAFIGSDKSLKMANVRPKELQRSKVDIAIKLARQIRDIVDDSEFLVGEQRMIPEPLLCDLIKISETGSTISILYDFYDREMPKNLGDGGFRTYLNRTVLRIFEKKNRQLREPKSAGKTTALILCIDQEDPVAEVYGSVENIRAAICAQPVENWSNIDRVFVQRSGRIFLAASHED